MIVKSYSSRSAGSSTMNAKKALVVWATVFVLLEVALRLFYAAGGGWREFLLPNPDRDPINLPVDDRELAYLPLPEHDRSGGYGPDTAPLRILCIGNSNVYGQYVDEERVFAFLVREALADRGVDARVVNAGVPGHTTRNIRAHLRQELARDSYDLVVFTAGWNDLHTAAAPAAKVRGLADPATPEGILGRIGIFRAADDLLERIVPLSLRPDTWNVARLDEFSAELRMLVESARASGATLYALELPCGLADDDGEAEREAAEGVVYPPVRRFSPGGYRRLFLEVERRYIGVLNELNVPILESGLGFRVPWESKKYLIVDQCHPGPKGHALIAASIVRRMESDGLLQNQR